MGKELFGEEMARNYDNSNQPMEAIQKNLHFLIQVLLREAPSNSQVLCVGVGTGVEIVSLAERFPNYRFVGVDPSNSMLDVCRKKLQSEDLLSRCELIHGLVQDLKVSTEFDIALCLLVGHHTSKEGSERKEILKNIFNRLKEGGHFIHAELSYDLSSADFALMLDKWGNMMASTGATSEKIQSLGLVMKEHLSLLPPQELTTMMRAIGFKQSMEFFQSLFIRAWYSIK